MRRREFVTLFGGAAIAWPSVARAQIPRTRPLIGTFGSGTPEQRKGYEAWPSFLKGLREFGYTEGRDFDITFRLAASTAKLPEVAREVVQLSPDVIFAAASANALAAKQATSTIPIVVAALGNLTALGLSENDLRRPTGNLTGIMPYVRGLPSKQLEIAREIVAGARKVGIVNDTSDIKTTPQWDEISATAAKLEIKIVSGDAQTTEDVEPTFRRFKEEGVDVVIVLQANFLLLDRAQIAAAAAATRLPTVYGYRELVDAGGLISYGIDLRACNYRAATYVYKILNGTPVADLPFEFPTRLDLVINLRTAKALGLTVPDMLLARADEVIE